MKYYIKKSKTPLYLYLSFNLIILMISSLIAINLIRDYSFKYAIALFVTLILAAFIIYKTIVYLFTPNNLFIISEHTIIVNKKLYPLSELKKVVIYPTNKVNYYLNQTLLLFFENTMLEFHFVKDIFKAKSLLLNLIK